MTQTAVDRIQGLSGSVALKAPVRVATTETIPHVGLFSVDGVLLVSGDRVLDKDNADATLRGIWLADTSEWSRAPDFNGPYDIVTGTIVLVLSGTVNVDTLWQVTTANPVPGAALAFKQTQTTAVTVDVGDVNGPASSTDGGVPTFSGTTGKVLVDSGKLLPSGDMVGTTDTQTLTNKAIGSGSSYAGTPVPISSGGSGEATRQEAIDALTAVAVSDPGQALVNVGGHVTWSTPAGGGDVVGPASAVSGNAASFSGTTGKLVADSGKALPAGTVVGTTDTQTLTNKSLVDGCAYTGSPVPITSGGSGQATAQAAINALTAVAAATEGHILTKVSGNAAWASASGAGLGDVSGPASSVNAAIPVFSGTTGKLLADSAKTLPTGSVVGTSDAQTLTNKTVGTGSSYTGTPVAFAYGGTGQATRQAAIDALTNVTGGAEGQVLTKSGGVATWSTVTGTGDVVGPASSVNNRVAVFNGTTGKAIKDGGLALPASEVVGVSDAQTLTNKVLGAGCSTPNVGGLNAEYLFSGTADFVLGPGSTKVSGTDNSAAMDTAIASGRPIYVPAGDYWIKSPTTRYSMQFASLYGPGVLWGETGILDSLGNVVVANVGYARLGKTLPVGTNRSHEMGSVGGLHIGGEDGGFGVRQWMGHHNWMQFQAARYGAPTQVQIYPSCVAITAKQTSPNTLTPGTGYTFDTTELFVGDYIGYNGGLYVIATVASGSMTVTKAFVGGSPGWATSATERPLFKAYETARGTCNTSGTAVTFVDGEQFPFGYTGDHQYVFINGTKYTVTAGPEVAGANTLTLSTSAGAQTGVAFTYYRQYAPWSYVSLFRLQGIAGTNESVGVLSLNTRNEVLLGASGTASNLVGNMRIEAPRVRIGGYEKYPWDGSDSRYGVEVIAPQDNESYGAHYVRVGGFNGNEAAKFVSWVSCVNHWKFYGGVSGQAIVLEAEGSNTDIDMVFWPKGAGGVSIGTDSATATVYNTDSNEAKLAVVMGTSSSPSTNNSPALWVESVYNGTPADYFAKGGLFRTKRTGGTGAFDTLFSKAEDSSTGTSGDAIAIHGLSEAPSSISGGWKTYTGMWAEARGCLSGEYFTAIGLEINAYQLRQRYHTSTPFYDWFDAGSAHHGNVTGMLINNYQGAASTGADVGKYWNDFGTAILSSTWIGGVNYRRYGYQTGSYITDVYERGLHIRGGYGDLSGGSTLGGIHLDGTFGYGINIDADCDRGISFNQNCNTAGIHLGPNKFNWGQGTLAGTVANEGDMLYNESQNVLYFNQGGVTTEMLACSSLGTSGSYTADRKITVRIGNVNYYLLASTTA